MNTRRRSPGRPRKRTHTGQAVSPVSEATQEITPPTTTRRRNTRRVAQNIDPNLPQNWTTDRLKRDLLIRGIALPNNLNRRTIVQIFMMNIGNATPSLPRNDHASNGQQNEIIHEIVTTQAPGPNSISSQDGNSTDVSQEIRDLRETVQNLSQTVADFVHRPNAVPPAAISQNVAIEENNIAPPSTSRVDTNPLDATTFNLRSSYATAKIFF